MVHVNLDGLDIEIPAETLAPLLSKFIYKAVEDFGIGFILKPFLAMHLAKIAAKIKQSGADFPAPDIRCREAKADFLAYAINYLVASTTFLASAQTWNTSGEQIVDADGEYIGFRITGIAPAITTVALDAQKAIAAPTE